MVRSVTCSIMSLFQEQGTNSNRINTFRPGSGKKWSHEDGSIMMFDYLIDDNYIDMEPEDVRFVKDLINGHVPKQEYAIKFN
jgi:hypothetical protein